MSGILTERKKESYKIFDEIAGTYDVLNHTLSLGIDILWRKKMLKMLPKRQGLKVLDLATGTGDVAFTLATDNRVASIKGTDLSKGMIKVGQQKVIKRGLETKINFEIGDGVTIPEKDESFDVITLSFGIRNFPDAQESLRNINRVLTKNGRALIMEFSIPKNPFFKALYFFYFRYILPFVGNIVSKHGDAYTYLNKSVEDFAYGKEFINMMEVAGLKNIKTVSLTFGIATLYIGDKGEKQN